MNWQAWLRALAPHYEEVWVCSRPSSEALYADFATRFIPHTIQGKSVHVVSTEIQNPEEFARVRALVTSDMDHLHPRLFVPTAAQRFIRFGTRCEAPSVDVLFHARGKQIASDRNWSVNAWIEMRDRLQAAGLTVGCVGLTSATLDVPGVKDFRDQPLSETMDCMASARAVMGPSSGPMHLASLCGAPHVVWTDRGIYRMGKTSRQKYESWWNPLGTPVRVLDEEGFKANPETVLTAVKEIGSFSAR
jgi:ADP-heptose:LPS heptosyltransferase